MAIPGGPPGEGLATLPIAALLAGTLAVCVVTDIRRRVIPDSAVGVAAAGTLAMALALDAASIPERLAAATAAGGFLLAAAVLRPGGMGMGDVKLAALLGLSLGAAVATALLAAFLTGSVAGALLLARHGVTARGMTIPFAPFLAVGALAALALS